MPISVIIPPIRPIVCLLVIRSLKSTIDTAELNTIALPFTIGKNNWLGKMPESLRLIKFIAKVQIPHRSPMNIIFLFNTVRSNLQLFFKKQKIIAQIKATNKNPELSLLYFED